MKTRWSLTVLSVMTVSATLSLSSDSIRYELGPTIIPKVSEIILRKGQNFTLICKGRKGIRFKPQRSLDEDDLTNFTKIERVVKTDDSFSEIALDLININEYAIGYYACFDDTMDYEDVLHGDIIEEPVNTPYVSYIYVYVNVSNMWLAPYKEIVVAPTGSKVAIGCKPTTPNISLELVPDPNEYLHREIHKKYSPKLGFTIELEDESNRDPIMFKCSRENSSDFVPIHWLLLSPMRPPMPKISNPSRFFLEGETFSINCSLKYQMGIGNFLEWDHPKITGLNIMINKKMDVVSEDDYQYAVITVENATKAAEGKYTCLAKNVNGVTNRTTSKIFRDKPFLEVSTMTGRQVIAKSHQAVFSIRFDVTGHPAVTNFDVYRDGVKLLNSSKYSVSEKYNINYAVIFNVYNLSVFDTGNYTLVATNGFNTGNTTVDLRVDAKPNVNFELLPTKNVLGAIRYFRCSVTGYPLPDVKWKFINDDGKSEELEGNTTQMSLYEVTSESKIKVFDSGYIVCEATNMDSYEHKIQTSNVTRRFLAYEVPEGFGIRNFGAKWFPEMSNVTLTCLASKYDFSSVSWYRNGVPLESVVNYISKFSHYAVLQLPRVSKQDEGEYECVGMKSNNETTSQKKFVNVKALQMLSISEPATDMDVEVMHFQPLLLTCVADAVPEPSIEWYRDGKELSSYNDSFLEIHKHLEDTIMNSTVEIKSAKDEHSGKYECKVTNGVEEEIKVYNVMFKKTFESKYLYVIGAFALGLMILLIYLVIKMRKERKAHERQLKAAGLWNFVPGMPESYNPDMGVDEQAELLPYDSKYEFDINNLKLGSKLGEGAFGVVYKASARGIINAEEVTEVAVKRVNNTVDITYIKALAREMKIMIHIGKHVNIVNLLGAITKNVKKLELSIIVEFCPYGNIHNYMLKHRDVFVNELTDFDDSNGKINRGFSSSSGNSASMYLNSDQSQTTNNTFLHSAETNASGRKVSEAGYMPEWRSNYGLDYDTKKRPLRTRDLLCWAFQIARGMEYLASKKVLHGDLAARNVLLCEDNIVKICDFGLARSMYKQQDNRLTYELTDNNCRFPIKWVAIECITDRVFSTESDVWSFGVVLWELFSLAKTPYPNVDIKDVLSFLQKGKRMDRPPYANGQLYQVMRQCWSEKPAERPSFTELQQTLGNFLEDSTKSHYLELDQVYMEMNAKNYCNGDVFKQIQLQVDKEGYLQMNPPTFSPRAQEPTFDFDPIPLKSTGSESGTESTPLINLNNLRPRTNSESENERTTSLNNRSCTPINEEDDVFIDSDTKVIKNNDMINTVTNQEYMAANNFDNAEQKNIQNGYVNVPVPVGLV